MDEFNSAGLISDAEVMRQINQRCAQIAVVQETKRQLRSKFRCSEIEVNISNIRDLYNIHVFFPLGLKASTRGDINTLMKAYTSDTSNFESWVSTAIINEVAAQVEELYAMLTNLRRNYYIKPIK